MTADDVKRLVRQQLASQKAMTGELHARLLRQLVQPRLLGIIVRTVQGGQIEQTIEKMWLLFEENASEEDRMSEQDGYKIVYNEEQRIFGLVGKGFAADAHPVLLGLYGDFMTTFWAM